MSESFVHSEIKAQRLGAAQLGRPVRIELSDLDDYLRRHEIRPHVTTIDVDAVLARVR